MSKIEWTEKTWNPIVGCSKVSAGCKNCYAIGMAWRLQHIGHSAAKYAGTVAKGANGQVNWTGGISVPNISNLAWADPHGLLAPLSWKKPAMVFVNSMSDIFHDAVPLEIIDCIFAIMVLTPKHTYQVLTKRPARMMEYFKVGKEALVQRWEDATYSMNMCTKDDDPDAAACLVHNLCEDTWPAKNIWLGVSVENQQAANERIPFLLQVPAAVRFLSCEPLLGPLQLDQLSRHEDGMIWYDDCLTGFKAHGAGGWYDNKIDWVIVGGESGQSSRPMHPDWVRSLRDQCQKAATKFFFKQWGMYTDVNNILPVPMEDFSKNLKSGKWVGVDNTGAIVDHVSGPNNAILMAKVGKDKAGRLLDGREWNEFPVSGKRKPVDDPDLHAGGFDY